MDLTRANKARATCDEKAGYFERLGFPNIAANFKEATAALDELIAVITSLNEVSNDRKDDGTV